MDAITSLFLVAIVAILYWLWKERAQPVPGLPLVKPFHFWFGSLIDAVAHRKEGVERNVKRYKEYGPGCYTSAFPMRGGRGSLWLSPNEELSEYVHKTNFKNYVKSDITFEQYQEFFGDGIFAVNGEKWRSQRKTASHIFSGRALKDDMAPVFARSALTVCEVLEERAKDGKAFNIQDIFFRYTINTFAEIGFGEDLGAITKDPNEIPFTYAFDRAQNLMTYRSLDPFWRFERFVNRFIPIFPREKEIAKSVAIVDKFAERVIGERLKEGQGTDLVSRFLAATKAEGQPANAKFLRDIVLNFLIAGRDTTACAMSWMTYLLCLHPDVEAKVLEEIKTVVGDEQVHYENAKNLLYTSAAFQETLRLYPSVPTDIKTAVNDDVLPNGVKVPKGTFIIYSPYIWGRAPELWGKDAEEFKPERWLGAEEKHSQFKYITFNAGPRLCLGKHVAILEGTLLMTVILKRFKLTLVPGRKIREQRSITLPIEGGLWVTATRREPLPQ